MRATSYADTTLGAVFFNFEARGEGDPVDELAALFRADREGSGDRAEIPRAVGQYVDNHQWPLFVHEWAHILQAIPYPALYLRAIRELRIATELIGELARRDDPTDFRITLREEWDRAVRHPTQLWVRFRFLGDDGVAMQPIGADDVRPGDLTETDLLEEDASIFQYKAEIDAEGTGRGYARWLRERSRYTATFRLLSRHLGPEPAYVALPPLVRASFHTTWPLTAFGRLVDATLRNNLLRSAAVGSEAYLEAITALLSYQAPEAVPDVDAALDHDLIRLGADAWRHLIDESELHPLHEYVARLTGDAAARKRLAHAMLHPHVEFERRGGGSASDFLREFWPPVMVVRVLAEGLSAGQTLVLPDPRLLGKPMPLAGGVQFSEFFVELLRQKQFAFTIAGVYADDGTHNCPHTTCPVHETRLCRRWLKIPERPEQCEFPGWLEATAERRIDVSGRRLVTTHH